MTIRLNGEGEKKHILKKGQRKEFFLTKQSIRTYENKNNKTY